MHANRLLGVPQMRQLRVKNDSCTIPDQFSEKIKVGKVVYLASLDVALSEMSFFLSRFVTAPTQKI